MATDDTQATVTVETTESLTSSSSSYSSPILSTFAHNPLTTTFTPPASCSGIYSSGGVYIVDDDTACLPSGFAVESTAYFSPGIACPSGYTTMCHDNNGVSSITTVTCCPYRADVSLSCVTPSTLTAVWSTLFCSWIAPEDGTQVHITQSADGTTSTIAASMSSPGGLNAYGVRMVYQASDLTTTTSSSSSSGATSSVDDGGGGGDDDDDNNTGLSTGAAVGVAVAVAVVGIALVVGALVCWRRRRRRRQLSATTAAAGGGGAAMAHGYYDPRKDDRGTPSELAGLGSQGVTNMQQERAELAPGGGGGGGGTASVGELEHTGPVELPGDRSWQR